MAVHHHTTASSGVMRVDGYTPIRDYAAIGDGRTVALVARDGHIDWMPLPTLDSPGVFSAILDRARGGTFALEPACPYEVERRYKPGTNVLETTFHTATGDARVTDAVNTDHGALLPWVEVARRVEGLTGTVPMRWRIEPRFDFGRAAARLERRDDAVRMIDDRTHTVISVITTGAGAPAIEHDTITGTADVVGGSRALIALTCARDAPLPRVPPTVIDRRIDDTERAWRAWSDTICYAGPWRDEVVRSALALRLLLFTPTGALAAAPTTSLPERFGGDKNWDYRYAWLRDSSFALDALLHLGLLDDATRMIGWLAGCVERAHPSVDVFYKLTGDPTDIEPESTVDLDGYRGSRPVRVGNRAHHQLQTGNYGDVFETLWLYYRTGNLLPASLARPLADTADHVCDIWPHPDSGIWELVHRDEYTISKMGAWVALDRAVRFADAGVTPADRLDRWRAARAAVHADVARKCWSDRLGSYVMAAGSERLDAACLLAARTGFETPDSARLRGTIDAIEHELCDGAFVYRYTGAQDEENAFVACSFWLVDALVRASRVERAEAVMTSMVAAANDVGLYSEEIDPATGEMAGNFPQALSHLALITAACTFHEAHGEDALREGDSGVKRR